jgi:putative addiction module component (TIGR02574 family)
MHARDIRGREHPNRVAGKRRCIYSGPMNKALRDQVMQLPPEERLELAYDLMESVPEADNEFELTDEQKAEIDRRMAEHERDPSTAVPWEEVRARLWSRLK